MNTKDKLIVFLFNSYYNKNTTSNKFVDDTLVRLSDIRLSEGNTWNFIDIDLELYNHIYRQWKNKYDIEKNKKLNELINSIKCLTGQDLKTEIECEDVLFWDFEDNLIFKYIINEKKITWHSNQFCENSFVDLILNNLKNIYTF